MIGPTGVVAVTYRVGLFDKIRTNGVYQVCINLFIFVNDNHLTFYDIREIGFTEIAITQT